MKETDYARFAVVFDLETGGLNYEPKKSAKGEMLPANPVLEIAMVAVSLDTLQINTEDRYHSLVKPYKSPEHGSLDLNAKALEINGITKEALRSQGKSLDVVCTEMVAWLKNYKGGRGNMPIMTGHNIRAFDMPFLRQMHTDNGSLNKFNDAVSEEIFDTLTLARMMGSKDDFGGKHTLSYVSQSMGVPLASAHSAVPDTLANAKVFVEMIKQMRGMGSGSSSSSNNNKSWRDGFYI